MRFTTGYRLNKNDREGWVGMSLLGPYVHRIDPIIVSVFGVHLWWYGLSYSLGFLNILLWLKRRRAELALSPRSVYALTLWVTAGVLAGGRFVEVVFYEWPFYREHPALIPAYWLGGMATHGLLLGAVTGIAVFCRLRRKRLLVMTDALAIPAAFIMGVGRLGNFIDGQIVGSLTDGWWGVQFPDADGFRHPVVLYDGLKNLALIPILLFIGRKKPPAGRLTGTFLFLYAFLRIFVDVFREYPTTLLGLATGQSLNILMSLLGACLLFWSMRKAGHKAEPMVGDIMDRAGGLLWHRIGFVFLLLFSSTLPSDWTQDIPARYSKRHPGLHYSALYPSIVTGEEPNQQANPSGD